MRRVRFTQFDQMLCRARFLKPLGVIRNLGGGMCLPDVLDRSCASRIRVALLYRAKNSLHLGKTIRSPARQRH